MLGLEDLFRMLAVTPPAVSPITPYGHGVNA